MHKVFPYMPKYSTQCYLRRASRVGSSLVVTLCVPELVQDSNNILRVQKDRSFITEVVCFLFVSAVKNQVKYYHIERNKINKITVSYFNNT